MSWHHLALVSIQGFQPYDNYDSALGAQPSWQCQRYLRTLLFLNIPLCVISFGREYATRLIASHLRSPVHHPLHSLIHDCCSFCRHIAAVQRILSMKCLETLGDSCAMLPYSDKSGLKPLQSPEGEHLSHWYAIDPQLHTFLDTALLFDIFGRSALLPE